MWSNASQPPALLSFFTESTFHSSKGIFYWWFFQWHKDFVWNLLDICGSYQNSNTSRRTCLGWSSVKGSIFGKASWRKATSKTNFAKKNVGIEKLFFLLIKFRASEQWFFVYSNSEKFPHELWLLTHKQKFWSVRLYVKKN